MMLSDTARPSAHDDADSSAAHDADAWLATADLLRQAGLALSARLQDALRTPGLTPTRWRALDTLRAGHRLRATEAARAAGLDPGTATRVYGALVDRGLCRRERVEGDRRALELVLTDEGRRVVLAMRPVLDATFASLFRGVGAHELRIFRHVLATSRAAREAAPRDPLTALFR